MNQEIGPYLKCRYGKGFRDREYFIRFKVIRDGEMREDPLINIGQGILLLNASALENNMWVNREDVLPLNDKEGLVKLIDVYGSDKEKSLVGIRNIDGVSRRYVPSSEIVYDYIKELQKYEKR